MKSFLRIACTCFGFAFFGCSGESTNDGSDDSEYFIAEMGSYKLEQNALLFTQGQCEAKDENSYGLKVANHLGFQHSSMNLTEL